MRYYYYYKIGTGLIRIKAKRKPFNSPNSYVVREWQSKTATFVLPCFPEIGYNKLRQFNYIGSEKVNE